MIPQFRPCATHGAGFPSRLVTIRKNSSITFGSVKNAIEIVWSVGNLANRNRKTKMLHKTLMTHVEDAVKRWLGFENPT